MSITKICTSKACNFKTQTFYSTVPEYASNIQRLHLFPRFTRWTCTYHPSRGWKSVQSRKSNYSFPTLLQCTKNISGDYIFEQRGISPRAFLRFSCERGLWSGLCEKEISMDR